MMKKKKKGLWYPCAKVLFFVFFCLAQSVINAKVPVSKNALIVADDAIVDNMGAEGGRKDTASIKNLHKIFVSSDALVVVDDKPYTPNTARVANNLKKTPSHKKISLKKTVPNHNAKMGMAYITGDSGQSMSFNTLSLMGSGTINLQQRKALQGISSLYKIILVRNYLIVFALLSLLLLPYGKKLLASDFFNRPPPVSFTI